MSSAYVPTLFEANVPQGADFLSKGDVWGTYVHLVVLGALASFAMAWSIGANDVANSFATSVGAKTITLWQACIIAAIFEFTGAIALGGEVARTIAGSITSPVYFQAQPEVFMYGMFCALVSAATMVTVATYFSAAVSTTHSIIGAVLGFGLVYGGSDAIVWSREIPDFPYRTGVVTVFMSWFIAPISAAIVASFWYIMNRTFILRAPNSVNRALWSLPVLALITVFVNIFFVLYKGAGKTLKWDEDGHKAAWVAAIVGAAAALLCVPAVFWLKRKAERDLAASERPAKDMELEAGKQVESGSTSGSEEAPKGMFGKLKAHFKYSLNADVHEDVDKDEHVAAMHANAEVFPPATEQIFKYLQVFTACCVSFAHGANDVANAIGPFAGIWYVYNNYNVSSSAETPKWILALGGAGIVVGLATYGYNIIKVLGVQLAKMTPSRGYCAELAAGVVISIASVYGLPVSTTQIIVGAEVGVGMSEGLRGGGTNWRLFAKTFLFWIISFVCAAFFSAAIFAIGVYVPSINDLDYVGNWQGAMTNVMREQIKDLNQTNLANREAGTFSAALNSTLTSLARNLTAINDFKKYGKTNQYDFMNVYRRVTETYFANTVPQITPA